MSDESVGPGEESLMVGVSARVHSVTTSQAYLVGHMGSVAGGKSGQCNLPGLTFSLAAACELLALCSLGAQGGKGHAPAFPACFSALQVDHLGLLLGLWVRAGDLSTSGDPLLATLCTPVVL